MGDRYSILREAVARSRFPEIHWQIGLHENSAEWSGWVDGYAYGLGLSKFGPGTFEAVESHMLRWFNSKRATKQEPRP